jgi:hypothetical protein
MYFGSRHPRALAEKFDGSVRLADILPQLTQAAPKKQLARLSILEDGQVFNV